MVLEIDVELPYESRVKVDATDILRGEVTSRTLKEVEVSVLMPVRL